ncbi:MAG: acetoacetate decarboxylase family protein [bacterium]
MYEGPFFSRFPQNECSFTDDQGVERRYLFPSFYESSRGMSLLMQCSWSKARSILPSRKLFPVPAGIGKALVVVAAFEYLHPQGMDPYNEVLFAVPVLHRLAGTAFPVVGLAVNKLIVDKQENVQRGKHLWGMDKSMGEFRFFDVGDYRVCEVFRNGRRAIRLEVPAKGKSRRFEQSRYLITCKDGNILRSRQAMSGRKMEHRKQGGLIPGADPFAVEIESLNVSPLPAVSAFYPVVDQTLSLPLESDPER